MKKILFLVVATILAEQVSARYDFYAVCSSGQTLYYEYYGSNSVRIVYPGQQGNEYDGYIKPTGNLIIPNVVSYGGNYSVVGIGDLAFHNCDGLTSITIPNSISQPIGNNAFGGCSNLKSVTINCDKDYIKERARLSFIKNSIRYEVINTGELQVVPLGYDGWGNTSPKYSGDIVIPAKVTIGKTFSVTQIHWDAFKKCQDLKSVAIPNSVTYIGSEAFRGCYNCTIYCQTTTKPSRWFPDWNPSECEVKWGAAYKFK